VTDDDQAIPVPLRSEPDPQRIAQVIVGLTEAFRSQWEADAPFPNRVWEIWQDLDPTEQWWVVLALVGLAAGELGP
jgi:hypothetical protein